jgi:hypothetical protein
VNVTVALAAVPRAVERPRFVRVVRVTRIPDEIARVVGGLKAEVAHLLAGGGTTL